MRVILPALTLLLTAGCASSEGFPSLARRDAERVSGTIAPPAPPVAVAPDPVSPETSVRLSQLESRARAGHARFQSRESRARQLVGAAQGAARASESWSVATVAVAELEAARSEVMISLADLDSLYAAERVGGSDGLAIGTVRDVVTALVTDEDRVLAGLGSSLRN
jgi:hypothetical protein